MKRFLFALIPAGICSIFMASSCYAAPQPPKAVDPSCVKMRTLAWKNYGAAVVDSLRFSQLKTSAEMYQNLKAHPPAPDRAPFLYSLAECAGHLSKQQIQSYILFNHP